MRKPNNNIDQRCRLLYKSKHGHSRGLKDVAQQKANVEIGQHSIQATWDVPIGI